MLYKTSETCMKAEELKTRMKRSFDSIDDDLLTVLTITCFPCLQDHGFVEVPLVQDDSAP